MPNIVPKLDESRTYTICPTCQTQGQPNVEMRRDTFKFICPFGHTFEYGHIQKLIQSGRTLEMVKTAVIEVPSANAVKWELWVNPQTKALLMEKFSGRVNVTMGTLFDAVAHDEYVFIDGPDAIKLRQMGVKSGKEMVAAVESAQDLQRQIDESQKQIKALQPIMQMLEASAASIK